MSDTALGKVGRVVVRIRGEESPGEVLVTVEGAPETYLAYAKQEISVDAPVLVVSLGEGRRVDVVLWDIAQPDWGIESERW